VNIMDKTSLLKKYYPKIAGFRDAQEPAIDALLNKENVLCLMPTGGGKSLIYQITGLALEKTTLVMYTLVALMNQQCDQLSQKGISAINYSGMDYRKLFRATTGMGCNPLPRFIFISPERISNDGYIEYVLKARHEDIGLVVIDEVHCVSQWGEGFRPAYRNIPLALDRIFGSIWPRILCLTATLNDQQKTQIKKEFRISTVVKGENLWRDNLHMEILNLKDGKEDTKDEELERIIAKYPAEKILVFVHRKYGKNATTRTLYEKYKDTYQGVAFFDSDMSDAEKASVMEGFINGSIKIVFATSAFGMGVDIEDIRVVVNYLISETIEQYYQEVGRAGRDGLPAYGYLLYTNQSKRGRKMLLNNTLCTEKALRDEWADRRLLNGQSFRHVNYESMNDDQRTAFALLMDYGMISVISKGVQSINCFEAVSTEGQKFLSELSKHSRSGLVSIIAKKTCQNINTLTLRIWESCVKGDIRMKSAPSKAIFYSTKGELTDELVAQILSDQDAKKQLRLHAFERFTDGIEAGKSAEQLVKEALSI